MNKDPTTTSLFHDLTDFDCFPGFVIQLHLYVHVIDIQKFSHEFTWNSKNPITYLVSWHSTIENLYYKQNYETNIKHILLTIKMAT